MGGGKMFGDMAQTFYLTYPNSTFYNCVLTLCKSTYRNIVSNININKN